MLMTCIYARTDSKKEIYKWVERSKRMANLSTRFNSINNKKVFPAISEAIGALVADTEPWARSGS